MRDWPGLGMIKQRQAEIDLAGKYKAVFCNPMGAEVFFDITETLCRCHSTIDDDSGAVALKNLACVLRARIGLADEDTIKLEIMNAPGVQADQ